MTEHLVVHLGPYIVAIDPITGSLCGLRQAGCPETLSHKEPFPPSTALIEIDGEALTTPRHYTTHRATQTSLEIESKIGPIVLVEYIELAGSRLERRMRIQNMSDITIRLTGAYMWLDSVAIGDAANCLLDAPANAIRPRSPLSLAASQASDRHTRDFAPGAGFLWTGYGLADAPDVGPGLIVVYNPELEWGLLSWYYSESETATLRISGDGTYPSVGYQVRIAGWLTSGTWLETGTQHIYLHQGDYQGGLELYRAWLEMTVLPPIYGKVDNALDWAGVYEVHPGQYGGLAGLAGQMPRLADMGIETVYLLPVMSHRNKIAQPWDENWERIGSPYAMHHFETIEPSLGAEQDLINLVEAAHHNKMKLLMDFVAQGCSLESPYLHEHPKWFVRDAYGQMVHSHDWNDTWSLDWANPDYQAYMRRWAVRFVKEYNIDGFRVDAPHGKEPNWDTNLPYHASATSLGTVKLLKDLRREIAAVKSDTFLYCELFGPLWIHSHDVSNDYHPYGMAYALMDQSLSPYEFGEYIRDYWAILPEGTPRICFTETHDTRSWPAYALRGSAISQALLGILVMCGFIPMIWAGQERGQERFIKGLLQARKQSAAVRRGKLLLNKVTIEDNNHYRHDEKPADQVFAVIRHLNDEIILGIVSLFPEQMTFRLGLPSQDIGLSPTMHYTLRDLTTGELWNEYGQTAWNGKALRGFSISPRMFRPYLFRIEPV